MTLPTIPTIDERLSELLRCAGSPDIRAAIEDMIQSAMFNGTGAVRVTMGGDIRSIVFGDFYAEKEHTK